MYETKNEKGMKKDEEEDEEEEEELLEQWEGREA